MPSTKDIRRRIKSVKNIQQITKAMKMVAAARLRKAQELAVSNRPYTDKMQEVLANVTGNISDDTVNPLLEVREVNNVGYLILSADKGLAGAYFSNLIKEVLPMIRGRDNVHLVTVGRKTRDYFKRRGYAIDKEFFGFSEKPSYEHARMLAKFIAEKFTSGETVYDEIYLAYTFFHSPINLKPTIIKLLPFGGENKAESVNELNTPATKQATSAGRLPKSGGNLSMSAAKTSALVAKGKSETSHDTGETQEADLEYIFAPSANEVLDLLLPKYLETVIYNALLQSAASELGARMTAMGSATDNAQELIAQLTLHYNKVRQATITREITEIVGGAEALK